MYNTCIRRHLCPSNLCASPCWLKFGASPFWLKLSLSRGLNRQVPTRLVQFGPTVGSPLDKLARKPYSNLCLKEKCVLMLLSGKRLCFKAGQKISLRNFSEMLLQRKIGTFPRKVREGRETETTRGNQPINSGRCAGVAPPRGRRVSHGRRGVCQYIFSLVLEAQY